MLPVRELRYNAAIQAHVHAILDDVRQGKLEVAAALARLGRVEVETERHSAVLAALVLGAAAASLARLLGADGPATAVAGVATALGLLARQQLARRHFALLTLPLTAAFIGAVLGGLAIWMDWTRTPELVLIVPALMVVPGPHLINGLLDLVDNYVPMSLARFGLATGVLLASALGIVLGVELTLSGPLFAEQSTAAAHLNVASDMALAGVVTCGFAVFYNTPWPQVWMATIGGMVGHGLRFLALESGLGLETATFLGGLAVGVVTAWIAWSRNLPVAVIAFAGAVTMIPGMQIYRALAGALMLARQANWTEPETVILTLGNALRGCLVVSALALGVILAARLVPALGRTRDSSGSRPVRRESQDTAHAHISYCKLDPTAESE
jgi:uncharacterized membrane protein YjjB (DUF3815 family)